MLARLSVLGAFLALIVVVAGCGGGGSSTDGTSASQTGGSGVDKATFIKEADTACSEYQSEVEPIKAELEELEDVAEPESKENLAKLGGLLHQALGDAEGELESIRALEVPQGDEATIEKMLGTAEEGNALAGEGATALEEADTQTFGELVQEGESLNAKARKLAESYGLKVCGQSP